MILMFNALRARSLRGLLLCPILFGCLVCIQLPPATAGVLAALGIEASVGVDGATRAWLSQLPSEWRDQINKIVEDTLSSVDLHLEADLTKLRQQLTLAEKEAACAWLGANQATVEVWKSQLPFLKEPSPVRDLSSYVSEERKRALNQRIEPLYMQHLYDDLAHKVAIVRCDVQQFRNAGAIADLDSMSNDLAGRWTELVPVVWTKIPRR
jgi:hypothetical protein